MILSAFASASTTKTSIGAWSHAATDLDFLSADYYISLGRLLERGGFDFIFFDDRLAMPAAYGGSPGPAAERGARAVKLDLVAILGLLSGTTERIGLGATYSTTYSSPYHVARMFATLDHLSKGRIIWNIVTSLNEDEAANFGTEFLMPERRYDRADEFVDIVTRLWDSWDPDALQLDREAGMFAAPGSVAAIDYEGEFLSSRGPLTVPRSPQGWPLLLQAGQSGRGRDFAAKWADLIFTGPQSLAAAREHYADQKRLVAAGGRDADSIRIIPAMQILVGETDEIVEAKLSYYDSLTDPIEQLIYISEQANFDFSTLPMDEPLTDDIAESVSGTRGMIASYIASARAAFGPEATLRQLAESRKLRGRGIVGTPEEVADQMEEWFRSAACDGFAIQPTATPGGFEDFVRLVVPVLRRRGLVAELPAESQPLRSRLGLAARTSR